MMWNSDCFLVVGDAAVKLYHEAFCLTQGPISSQPGAFLLCTLSLSTTATSLPRCSPEAAQISFPATFSLNNHTATASGPFPGNASLFTLSHPSNSSQISLNPPPAPSLARRNSTS